MPFQGARSGLKMGSWLPADAVTPWSVRGRPLVGHWELRFGPFIVASSSAPRGAGCSGWRWETFVASPSWRWSEAGGSRPSGVAEGGWEQPRQSWVGSGLPDGPGPVSETGRYTRGTGAFTPLQATPALIRRMWAGWRCVPAPHFGRGTPGSVLLAWAGRPR